MDNLDYEQEIKDIDSWNEYRRLEGEILDLRKENRRLRDLVIPWVKAAICPECDGSGTCQGYTGYGDHEIWQCQWCDIRDRILGEINGKDE